MRRRLDDELGALPSPELQAAHAAVCAENGRARGARQPPARPQQLRRPRARGRRAGPAARRAPAGDADRHRRLRQDAAGDRGRPRPARRRVDRGARRRHRARPRHGCGAGPLGLREARLLESQSLLPPDADERLIEALAGRDTLLLLDNCEHLIEARRPRGVSLAITRPRSMTVISSASSSASEVLRRQQHGRPVVDERAHDVPHVSALGGGRARSSARRGRSPTGGRRGSRRGRVGGACRRGRSVPAGRRPPPGRTTRQLRRAGAGVAPPKSSSRAIMIRFWRPLSVSSTDAYWPVSPIDSRTFAGSAPTSWPSTRPSPSGRSSVARPSGGRLAGAVGPSRRRTTPRRTARSTPSSAFVSPKRLTSPSAWTAMSVFS